MKAMHSGHVSSDRLGEAARHGSLEGLRDWERGHVETCEQCRGLYAGYRLTDKLLSAGWRETILPESAIQVEAVPGGPARFLARLRPNARSLVPAALAVCLVALVALGVLLPQFVTAPGASSSRSPIGSAAWAASHSVAPSATPQPVPTASTAAAQTQGTGTGKAPGGIAAASPTSPPSSASLAPLSVSDLPGWPVMWSPDGAHLLVAGGSGWSNERAIEILDQSGRVTGSFSADSATWVDSNTVAAATDAKGPGGQDTISLVNLSGHVTATLSGKYGASGSGAVLLGSATGLVAVASMGGWGPSSSSFFIWNGHSAGQSHDGIPIGFSRDGKKIAVLHSSGGSGGNSSGWLEIVSSSTLATEASFPHTSIHVPTQGDGPGYGPEVAFSPDGDWLFVSGTLVDLSHGSTVRTGDGGWLPDGSLLTSNGGKILRWQGTHSTPDARFQSGGSVSTSLHGEVVEYFGDGRQPLLLTSGGSVRQLQLQGVTSLDDAQLAPNGAAFAFSGRGARGGVTQLAQLK